jgi:hypothetical protein
MPYMCKNRWPRCSNPKGHPHRKEGENNIDYKIQIEKRKKRKEGKTRHNNI